MRMIRKIFCITCVLALALCAVLLPERHAESDFDAKAGMSRTAVRTPRTLREGVQTVDTFFADSGESDAEWQKSWEWALAIDDGEDAEEVEFDFDAIDWSDFDVDMEFI